MTWCKSLLNRLFRLKDFPNKFFRLEEISGGNRCPTYLFRWTLLRTPWFAIYLHRFVGEDWSKDLHDHPKRFLSIGLAGGYVEHTPQGSQMYFAPWIRTFPAEHTHRLTLGPFTSCWTLVIVGPGKREWGFWHAGSWIQWREYIKGKFAGVADRMKSCAE
jgi:hypothetical protein